jgi:origin recognition complex subunit 5
METLTLLLSTSTPPPLIYIHHPHHPTASLEFPTNLAKVDAIECYTPKILWSAIISKLEGDQDTGLIDSIDSLIRRLQGLSSSGKTKIKGGKGKEIDSFSIIITKAERLPKVMGSGWSVMTRLAELVSLLLTL